MAVNLHVSNCWRGIHDFVSAASLDIPTAMAILAQVVLNATPEMINWRTSLLIVLSCFMFIYDTFVSLFELSLVVTLLGKDCSPSSPRVLFVDVSIIVPFDTVYGMWNLFVSSVPDQSTFMFTLNFALLLSCSS